MRQSMALAHFGTKMHDMALDDLARAPRRSAGNPGRQLPGDGIGELERQCTPGIRRLLFHRADAQAAPGARVWSAQPRHTGARVARTAPRLPRHLPFSRYRSAL